MPVPATKKCNKNRCTVAGLAHNVLAGIDRNGSPPPREWLMWKTIKMQDIIPRKRQAAIPRSSNTGNDSAPGDNSKQAGN